MKVIVLGGDGYLGWPCAMHLSDLGMDVVVIDNFFKRDVCKKLRLEPLFDDLSLAARIDQWHKVSKRTIRCILGDLTDAEFVNSVFSKERPECIVHYAEQPSAPYSMLDQDTARLTLENNLLSTLNIIFAVKEYCPQSAIIKLGTMGEYGTPNIDIEEGWLDVLHKGREAKFLFPREANSLYHTSKIMDTDLLWLYVRLWGIRVTDLMQGPVYGFLTEKVKMHPALWPRLCHDSMFGTVVNRFLVQASKMEKLSVYGKGGQTRGFISIEDSIASVALCISNPPPDGEMRIINQFTETFSVRELAERVRDAASDLGLDVEIESVKNPRMESEEHYYNPAHTELTKLGLTPHLLTDAVIQESLMAIQSYKAESILS